jgi:hypothetical protein
MKRVLFTVAALALASSCSSIDNRVKAHLIPPELAIRQINAVQSVSRSISGGPLPINFQVDIANRSNEPIQLERLEVQSVGAGAYTINQTTRPFKNVTIAPDMREQVEFWVPAVVEDTITGANGPVTLRVTAYFGTELGKFREVYVRTVNDTIGSKPRVD